MAGQHREDIVKILEFFAKIGIIEKRILDLENKELVEYMVPMYTIENQNSNLKEINELCDPDNVKFYPEWGEGLPTIGITVQLKKAQLISN